MNQQIICNENAAGSIGGILLQHGITNPFVIMGRHFQLQNKREPLLQFQYNSYIKEDAEVTKEEIIKCYGFFSSIHHDAVIAIGGGRVMDIAKAVICEHYKNNQPLMPVFICVPTTAGSGSEATQFAVVYEDKTKISVDESFLLPGIAVLDAVLTYSLPPLQTAVSGTDALAQAIESYWNIRANAVSMQCAAQAITILLNNLPAAVTAPEKTNRKNMLWGAHLAGKAINITRTTGPHALSYYLTAHYNIPHGQAVAFFLPLFFIYNAGVGTHNCNHPGGQQKVLERLQEIYALLNVSNAHEAMEYIRGFIKNAGLAITLAECGIDKGEMLDSLLREINKERFDNNPVALDIVELKKICMHFL